MKPHLEHFKLQLTDLQRSESYEFVGGRDFRVDFRAVLNDLLLPLSPRLADLLRIASSIYFIDRLIMRDRKHGPKNWPRKISCSVEVRELEFWMTPGIHEIVQNSIQFVSGDQWEITFLHDRTAPKLPNGRLYTAGQLFDTPPMVSLYSGGLDSAAGLAHRIADGQHRLIPVIVRHRTDIVRKATQQLDQLSQYFNVNLTPLSAVMSMIPPKRLIKHEELSQRARAFLFVAVAGVVAGVAGSSVIEMYESGIGAVNAPLLSGMEGSQSTRGAHPTFLSSMSRLLSLVADHRIEVTLPFLNATKGDVVKSLANSPLKDVATSTISCSHFPVRLDKGGPWKSCGLCPACIFRRLALYSAGIEESPEMYQHDLLDPVSCRLDPKKLRYLMAYLLHVDSLSDLDQGRLPLVIAGHLRSTGLLSPSDSQQPYVELFRRFRSEWHGLLEHARRTGCDWASRIDVSVQAA